MKSKDYLLPVLLYHRVVKSRSEAGRHNIYLTEKRLRSQLSYLKKNHYETITFNEIHNHKITNWNKKVILTFDDGYEDNYTLLFPLLKEFGFTAVIFLVTQSTNNTWGIREGEPALSLMSHDQIREMDQYGIEFGGHTQTHPALNHISLNECKKEVQGCKKDIESLLNKSVISFAYPFGGINKEVKETVKEAGFIYGVSTKSGPYKFNDDLFEIRRIEVSCRTRMFGFKRKVSGHYFNKFKIF